MTNPSDAAGLPASTPTVRLALAGLILLACLLAASTWRVYSNTWDEPEHLAAGIELLDRGKYEYDTEHPPIARIMLAIGPYLAGARSFGTPPPDGTQEGIAILYSGGHYDLYLTLARLGTLPFLALLLFTTWLWARRLGFSEAQSLLSVLLVASVPPVLGHAALAALDVAAAATTLLALYALQRWLSDMSWRNVSFFGVAAGVAVGTKFSAIPFLGLGLLVLSACHIALRREGAESAHAGWSPHAARRRLASLVAVALVALIPIVLAYGVLATAPTIAHRFDWAVRYLLQEHGLSHVAGSLLGHIWLPHALQSLVEGIIAVKAHNDSGHVSFLMGTVRSTGWWYFYLVALAVKTPLPLLAAGCIGVPLLARKGCRERDTWALAPLLLVLVVLGFSSFFSHINIGIRHVLVLYPFLALGAVYALTLLWRAVRSARNRALGTAGAAAVVVLVGWQVSTLWSANPDYLPYFNEAVSRPEKILVDSDLDWGQDLRRLERRVAEIKVPQLNLAYRGTVDLAREPLPPTVILPPRRPVTGWIAISALAREHDIAGYAWLNAYRPMERIGKTIDLYYIPAPRQ